MRDEVENQNQEELLQNEADNKAKRLLQVFVNKHIPAINDIFGYSVELDSGELEKALEVFAIIEQDSEIYGLVARKVFSNFGNKKTNQAIKLIVSELGPGAKSLIEKGLDSVVKAQMLQRAIAKQGLYDPQKDNAISWNINGDNLTRNDTVKGLPLINKLRSILDTDKPTYTEYILKADVSVTDGYKID